MSEAEIVVLMTFGFMLFFLMLLVLIPAYQAYHRGYNPIVWGLAGMFSMNPLFILVVLAMVPHRARVQRRAEFRADIDAKLAALGAAPAEAADGAARADTFTVGDEATRLPHRSIGDDLTRM